jgi:hypothetical protein
MAWANEGKLHKSVQDITIVRTMKLIGSSRE